MKTPSEIQKIIDAEKAKSPIKGLRLKQQTALVNGGENFSDQRYANGEFRSEQWRENVRQRTREKHLDPREIEAIRTGYEQFRNDEDRYNTWRDNLKKGAQRHAKQVQTPEGVFGSRREAAKHYGRADSWVLSQIKKYDDWYYIEE